MSEAWGTRADLVGRAAELRRFNAVFESVGRGHGRTYFVVGEYGAGKTRLAARAGLLVLRGRADETPVPYRPLSEALLSAFRRHGPPSDPVLHPYRPALSRLVPEWREGSTSDVDDGPVVLGEAVLRLLARLGQPKGCLVLLEDLHLCDPATLSTVEYLSDNLDRELVALVGTVRAEQSPA